MTIDEAVESNGRSDRPRVSVVVVTWNSGELLAGCLASFRNSPPAGDWEVIVVDNGSTDGTVAEAKHVSWVRLIENRVNRGLAAANNQGLSAASGDYVVLSNPDVEYRPGALDAMLDAMARHPRAAFVFPQLLHPDGTLQTSAGSLPTLGQALRGRRSGRHWTDAAAPTSGFWWDSWAHDSERLIGHGGESCYIARRSAVEQFGLQDERFKLDWEGIDWCARAQEAGWEVWICPAAEVVHIGGASIAQAPVRWVIQSHLGLYRYFSKRKALLLRPLLAGAVVTRAAVKLGVLAAGRPLYQRAHRGPPGNP